MPEEYIQMYARFNRQCLCKTAHLALRTKSVSAFRGNLRPITPSRAERDISIIQFLTASPFTISSGSFRRWPSCQIQGVSIAVRKRSR